MSNQKLIRFDPDTMECLRKVERGERTKFVNECIRAHAIEAGEKIQKKEAGANASENSKQPSNSNASSSTQPKPSEEADLTTKKNSQGSAQKTPATSEHTKILRLLEHKP